MATNPNTSNTKLLIPMTADPFADISVGGTHGNATKNGNAQLDSVITNPYGGTGCLLLDGSGDYLSIGAASADWDFGTGELEISTWVRVSDFTGGVGICGIYDDDDNFLAIYMTASYITVQIEGAAKEIVYYSVGPFSLSVDTWYYISIHKGFAGVTGGWSSLLDGVEEYSGTTNTTELPDLAGALMIGRAQNGVTTFEMNGYMSEFRVVKGDCPRTANFEVPSIHYPSANQWCGSVNGVANPTYIHGVDAANIVKVNGVVTIE